VLILKFEFLSMIGFLSILTVLEPLAVSLDWAMLGYGMGIGPAGVGVLHTSGKDMVIPVLPAWTTVIMFTLVVTGMFLPRPKSVLPALLQP
jgi:hypothetical protein